ncbi:sigma-54-dependent transcriptional regulator [Thiovibrio frasassiensis]|uniref:Sigma-54 dependent transcriptional regulator n=1 Tax=Thiovibrio frasassiensis TaxID=2984131 RepID=A0A9X4MDX3_9BACT|nr:sigma-54 dependent transcriptional regulator [Thiovibrio frasassiensis]MDG4475784.1 sigma-54 dependent transcriptional regulator [Thiovibrio frasassiensis]
MTAEQTNFSCPEGEFSPSVLIVDDDLDMLAMLERVVRKKCRCEVKTAPSGEKAWEILQEWHPDLVLTDIKMPGLDGLTLLKNIKKEYPAVAVVMMSGHGTVESAITALKNGAYDFIQKPFDQEHLLHILQRCLEHLCLLEKNRRLQSRLADQESFPGFIGRSSKIKEVYRLIGRLADTDVTVLIRGESGTGKELAARSLHGLSARNKKPMVTVNCPALPEQILESELFGYAKGAFSGANHDKKGLFLEANTSTILLDEIGDLPIALQTKLLRVLQEKEIMPLGQTKSLAVDVRVLASTNQDLEEKMRQGLFREDLFYRLNVVTITVPPLRERPEDIPPLAQHFLALFAKEYNHEGLIFAADALPSLVKRHWKGNVRELQNVIKRAVLLADDEIPISAGQLREPETEAPASQTIDHDLHGLHYNLAKQQLVEEFSAAYLTHALQQKCGNVTAAALASGMNRQAFQKLMRRFGLVADKFRTQPDH